MLNTVLPDLEVICTHEHVVPGCEKDVPGLGLVDSGRRLTLHLPTGWPWEQAWQTLWDTNVSSTGPPASVTP